VNNLPVELYLARSPNLYKLKSLFCRARALLTLLTLLDPVFDLLLLLKLDVSLFLSFFAAFRYLVAKKWELELDNIAGASITSTMLLFCLEAVDVEFSAYF
jgi:hypothetical protein